MTLPVVPGNSLSLSQVNTELGYSSTALISLNDTAVRTLAGVSSGTISFSDLSGKSNRYAQTITISADTQNYTFNTAKITGYSTGTTDATLVINSGIYIGSTSTGSYALTIDSSWAAGDTVTVTNNGLVIGAGGAGGTGNSGAGSGGGPSVLAQKALTWTNSGTVGGGGGGGGGGYQASVDSGKGGVFYYGGGGGGGGQGYNGGAGGGVPGGPPNYTAGAAGSAGTKTSAGSGGAGALGTGGTGGAGGTLGSAGASPSGAGGAGGAALSGKSLVNSGAGITGGTVNGGQS